MCQVSRFQFIMTIRIHGICQAPERWILDMESFGSNEYVCTVFYCPSWAHPIHLPRCKKKKSEKWPCDCVSVTVLACLWASHRYPVCLSSFRQLGFLGHCRFVVFITQVVQDPVCLHHTALAKCSKTQKRFVLPIIQNRLLFRRVQGQLGKLCLPLSVMKCPQMGLVREQSKLLLAGIPPLQEHGIFTLRKFLCCPLQHRHD